jgi:hypothetical protein
MQDHAAHRLRRITLLKEQPFDHSGLNAHADVGG